MSLYSCSLLSQQLLVLLEEEVLDEHQVVVLVHVSTLSPNCLQLCIALLCRLAVEAADGHSWEFPETIIRLPGLQHNLIRMKSVHVIALVACYVTPVVHPVNKKPR